MFDLDALQNAVVAHGKVARIVLAGFQGSSPREVGAAMLVWDAGQSGTIGGGALEWQAIQRARAMLDKGGVSLDHQPLGPTLGQCCGGAVTLLTEVYNPSNLPEPQNGLIARAVDASAMPLALHRLITKARAQGIPPQPQLLQGWMVEPLAQPTRHIWVWGAGHVGRALVGVLSPLPGIAITWIDTARDRFPDTLPDGVTPIWTAHPETLAAHAPQGAEHLIVTYSHALDLELCHQLLTRGFGWLGLIGSATKWARFRARLANLGHAAPTIARITCPIGDVRLGKHPQAIAIGVALQLLTIKQQSETEITDDNRESGASAH